MEANKVPDIVADMEVDKVADMIDEITNILVGEVDKVADESASLRPHKAPR